MTKPMSRMLIYVTIFFMLVFGWYAFKKIMFYYFVKNYKAPPVYVTAQASTTKSWQPYLSAVGSLSAKDGVELSPDVAGTVEEVYFRSGEMVNKGQAILRLRADIEEANLKLNKAKLALAKINFEREDKLFDKNVASKAALDARRAQLLEAEAGVESVEAQIRHKLIRAPFDGKVGIRQVNVGQFLSPGTNIVTLQALDPLYVTFNLPEQYLPQLYVGQEIEVELNFEKGKIVKGIISAINAKVEPTTRNITVRSTIANPDHRLYPGMYALVKVLLKQNDSNIIVPQTAISYSLSGDYIFVVKEEEREGEKALRAYRQYIKVGERRGHEVAITEGLTAGEMVITSGQLKLQNGAKVVIDETEMG